MADQNDGGELESAERSTIATVKTKGAVVKRRITNTLKKLQGTIEQYKRKSIIRGYVNILEESLNEAQVLNNQLLALLPEQEHENAINWYEEELERVQEAKLEAEAHLEERKEESYSALSSLKLSKSSADSHVAEIRAKMASAEIKAKQLEMEEERRKKEFAKQLEIKHKIEQARNEAERIEFEAKERRKTQEAKDEAARLATEAENLEKVRNFNHYNDPESLPYRLRDFDDSLALIPLSGFTQSVQTSHVTPLSSSSQPQSGAVYNLHATQVTSSPMTMKPRPSVSFMVPKSSSQSKTSTPVYQSWVECLPKTAQTDVA